MSARPLLIVLVLAACVLAAGPAGANWVSGGDSLCTATDDQFNAVAVSDGVGGAIVAWQDRRNGGDYDIYAQRIDGSGNLKWTHNGVPVCTETGDQINVAICSDGARGAIITWEDYRFSSLDSDIYAVRLDSLGIVRAKWTANGTPVCNAAFYQGNPAIVSDGAGGAIIAWEDLRSDALYQAYLLRLRSDGTVAAGWTANGVAVAPASGNQYAPALFGDGAGGSYVVWSDDRDLAYPSSGLFAQRVTGAGASAAGWPVSGLLVCSGASSPAAAALAADATAGAYVAWGDQRGASTDLYAQRLRPTGSAAWSANGIAVCAVGGDQAAPSLVTDGQGGFVVAWNDTRGGAGAARVYAQRVDSLGAAGWAANGVDLISTGDRLGDPALTSDGAGGAIMATQAYSLGNETDLYAQRVTAAGALPWGASTPTAICVAAGNQQGPQPVTDGSGGAIVAWYDNRSNPEMSTNDIYAQRVLANGLTLVTAVPAAIASGFALCPPRPNPSRGPAELALTLSEPAEVTVVIWDVAGRRVRTLAAGQTLGAGPHAFIWDGSDDGGTPLPPGLYLARATAGLQQAQTRLVRIR